MSARQQEQFLKSKCLQRHNCSQAARGEGHSNPPLQQAGPCANPSESNRSRRNLSRLPDFSIWLGCRALDMGKLCLAGEEIPSCQGPGPAMAPILSFLQNQFNALYEALFAFKSSFYSLPMLQ